MTDSRARFLKWTNELLTPASFPCRQRAAAHAWCAWGLKTLGVDEGDHAIWSGAFAADSVLASGKAISPLNAARCVREYRRTAVFLQAMDEAICAAREKFPGETIQVLEAGCGPLAPLSLPFALRYAPDEVRFTLLDLHPPSLDGARAIATELGVNRSIRSFLAADATTVRLSAAERPHVIGCEVLLRALKREPQVAATLNLARQLRPGGFFLPEKIDVDAGLLNGEALQRRMIDGATMVPDARQELGRAFSLDAYAAAALVPDAAGRLRGARVAVPPHDPGREPLGLFTRIRVFREHKLGDFESSLNLPERLRYPGELDAGGSVEFTYTISSNPGLHLHAVQVAGESRCFDPVAARAAAGERLPCSKR